MATAYLTHPDCAGHDMGAGHPECPQRLRAIEDALHAAGLWDGLLHIEAPAASREQLLRAHSAAHIDAIAAATPARGSVSLGDDITLCPLSWRAALRAAGAVVAAVDAVLGGQATNAFCAVRPPGHHALRDHAMGFCVFNNVAVGALHALESHGLQRVAIVDFDVHHGNGTEAILGADPRVVFCSSFQHPYYPFCGADSRSAQVVNVPLPAWSGGAALRSAWQQRWRPALDAFAPQLLLVSAGFDAHRDDDMAMLGWTDDDYAWISAQLVDAARHHCGGRLVSTLEGGYALAALGRSVAAHVAALCAAG